jgi:hypothetical protein
MGLSISSNVLRAAKTGARRVHPESRADRAPTRPAAGCRKAAARLRARVRAETGQALVVTVLFAAVLIGAAAMAVDVGSWYREQRQAQTAADAAALSGAQSLPWSPAQALADAQTYATKNGGLGQGAITFRSDFEQNDTVVVNVTKTAPSFFAKLFGIDSTTVHATAAARSAQLSQALGVAPIVINKNNPMLAGPGCPCFNTPATLPLGKTGAPGAFALVNLDTSTTGAIAASTIASWIQNGFSAELPLGDYFSDPGAKWNDAPIQNALQDRLGSNLLFPVYDTLSSQGVNAYYHVIGWAGFHLDSETASGTSGTITGYFTQMLWNGIQSTTAPTGPDYGVHSIALIG